MAMMRSLLVLVALFVVTGSVSACGGDDEAPATEAATTTTALLTSDALPVLVAEVVVPAGTDAGAALRDGLLRQDTVTRAQFPEDAIVSSELIDGMVAATDIGPGAIITAGMFVDPRDPAPTTVTPAIGPASTAPPP